MIHGIIGIGTDIGTFLQGWMSPGNQLIFDFVKLREREGQGLTQEGHLKVIYRL